MNFRGVRIGLLAASLLLMPIAAAGGALVYVDDDSPGGDGSSWATAFKYLQDALVAADANDEIRVAQGTYVPDRSSVNPGGSVDREATFQLIGGVTIKGGYAGYGEPDPNERDVEAYATVLSGDLSGDDGPDFLNNDENSYHVVTGGNIDGTTVLDGFTITAGNANGSSGSNQHGGGMYNSNGSPTLIDCIFRGNIATGEWCMGGGMHSDSGSPVLTNCIFSGNLADAPSGYGGGMYCSHGCDSPRLTNCIFIGNRTEGCGGGLLNYSLNMTLTNCMFIGNSASWKGGGLHNQRDDGYVTVTNCMFIGNTAQQQGGGGMFSEHTVQIVTNCTFSGNSAGLRGGGIYNAMGNCGGYQEITTLTNCILRDNSAEEGPEIALYSHETSIRFCNIQGGRLDIYIVNNPEWYLTWDANSNIDANPLFVDADNDDYHLRWDSPCINVGDPNGDYAGRVDIDGEPRVMTGRVDMGADEVGEKQADFTRDGLINLEDISVFSESWPENVPGDEWYVLCDLYEDERIDALDVAEFVKDWLWQADWYEQ